MRKLTCVLTGLLAATYLFTQPLAAETAYKSQPNAEKYLNNEAKGKLVKIIGPKPKEGLAPTEWQYIFFDEFADRNGRFVEIYQGKILTELTDRYVELGKGRLASYKSDEIIPPAALKVDSDAAVQKAISAGQLGNYKITGANYELAMDKKLKKPVWDILLFGIFEGEETKVAEAQVTADDGKVVKFKLLEENLGKEKPEPSTKR